MSLPSSLRRLLKTLPLALLMSGWVHAQSSPGASAPKDAAGGMEVKHVDLSRNPVSTIPSSCFWIGALTRREPALNILYPDADVTYWVSQFRLPPGARLRLSGEYPHARYIAFTAYNSMGSPTDGVNDQALQPEPGSTNPFVVGHDRGTAKRHYVLNILNQSAPADTQSRLANTLYARADESMIQLYYRVYVPDRGLNVAGGVGLPQAELVQADGSVLAGDALCQQLVVSTGAVRDRAMPRDKYQAMLKRPGVPPTFPALPSPKWEVILNPALTLSKLTLAGTPDGDQQRLQMDQTRRGGQYPTLDNRYMLMYIDRRLGPVLTLQAQLPTTPATRSGVGRMGDGQLRYWSLCFNRSLADTSVDDCLADEDVTLDAHRRYTILVSRPEDRPANARPECGVTWLNWGALGDGAGNRDGGFLMIRNMLPAPDFKQSIFDIQRITDEESALGPYYPKPVYQSKDAFEERGCDSRS
ncbi:MAG: hypothetical protein R3E94_03010 [Burkholderiaceae bacterium]